MLGFTLSEGWRDGGGCQSLSLPRGRAVSGKPDTGCGGPAADRDPISFCLIFQYLRHSRGALRSRIWFVNSIDDSPSPSPCSSDVGLFQTPVITMVNCTGSPFSVYTPSQRQSLLFVNRLFAYHFNQIPLASYPPCNELIVFFSVTNHVTNFMQVVFWILTNT